MAETDVSKGEVTRRRDDVLQTVIREAIRSELAERGYAGITYEGVARRAATSRSVIYRRYRSRAHMVTDALPSLHWPREWKSSGSLRQDLIVVFTTILERFNDVGIDTYRRLGAESDDELFDETTALITKLVSSTIGQALSDARDRGELGPALIPEAVKTTLLALVRNEVFFTRNGIDENTLITLIDTVYLPLLEMVSHASKPCQR